MLDKEIAKLSAKDQIRFKQQCNKKALRAIEEDFSQKYNRRSLPDKEADIYEWYIAAQARTRQVKLMSTTFSVATFILLTRVPRRAMLNSRLFRLSSYVATYAAHSRIQSSLDTNFVHSQFSNVSLALFSDIEIKKMFRAYSIKATALQKDKADLKKYKFDPQSYH